MKQIKFKIDISYNGKMHFKDEIIEIKSLKEKDLPMIGLFNEKGYIEPLSVKELCEINEIVLKGGNK